jgi:hypothetical protein
MATDLTLLNAALTRTGNDPLTSLTSGGAKAAIAASNYEEIVKNELSLQPWKKATKIAQLDRLDADVVGDPPEPWTAAYQLPDDLVDIRTVKVAGAPIEYEWHGNTIVCNADEADEVILHYVWRIPETWFPPWLREGIIRSKLCSCAVSASDMTKADCATTRPASNSPLPATAIAKAERPARCGFRRP